MKTKECLTEANKDNEVPSFAPFVTFCQMYSGLRLLRLFAAIPGLALGGSAQAQFTWTTNADNTITITSYTGSGGDVTIPTNINGLTVSSIGDSAFGGCTSLTNVTIPNGVTIIGNGAFAYCSSLRRVYFTGNPPAFGYNVFPWFSIISNRVTVYVPVTTLYFLPGSLWPDPWWHLGYLPMSSFAGTLNFPLVLWNPVIKTGDGSFGVQNGQFGFNITGSADIPISVEACTNLANPVWSPLATMTLTNGSVSFSEPLQTNTPARFYRIGSP